MPSKIKLHPGQFAYPLVLVTLAVYIQVLQFDFINLDDMLYLMSNPHADQGLSWAGIKWAWTKFADPYYMPMTWTSFLLDRQLFGVNASGSHLINLLLHLVNSLLLLHILRSMTGRFQESAMVALLFALHPQHVEAVAWIAERKEVLSTMFGLLSLEFYIRYTQTRQRSITQHQLNYYHQYLLAIFFLMLSLLSKPTWVTLPCLLLLIDWWPLQRPRYDSFAHLIYEKVPFFVLSILFSVLLLYSVQINETGVFPVMPTEGLPFLQKLNNIPVIYATYISKSIFPINLAGWYSYPTEPLPVWQIFFAVCVLFFITLAFIWQIRQRPFLFMGWLWFTGTLFPMVIFSLVADVDVFISDRWTYLPHIGLFICIIWGATSSVFKSPALQNYKMITISILLLLLITITFNHVKNWRNSETYWLRVLEVNQNAHFPHFMLAIYYRKTGLIDKALPHYKKAHQILPVDPYYILDLGNTLHIQGRTQEAWDYYHKLLNTPLANSRLLVEMAKYAIQEQRYDSAKNFLHKVMQGPPDGGEHDQFFTQAHLYLAHTLAVSGQKDAALNRFNMFLQSFPQGKNSGCNHAARLLLELADPGVSQAQIKQSLQLLNQLCK